MTRAERRLWRQLQQISISGTHFRRQATIGPYFADFASHEQRIVIEVDGGQHNLPKQSAADAARTAYLNAHGYRVLRFWNNDVLGNIDGVMSLILDALTRNPRVEPPTPVPSPPQAGGGGPHNAA
jgi:very-short-patch-repair endonuclease